MSRCCACSCMPMLLWHTKSASLHSHTDPNLLAAALGGVSGTTRRCLLRCTRPSVATVAGLGTGGPSEWWCAADHTGSTLLAIGACPWQHACMHSHLQGSGNTRKRQGESACLRRFTRFPIATRWIVAAARRCCSVRIRIDLATHQGATRRRWRALLWRKSFSSYVLPSESGAVR